MNSKAFALSGNTVALVSYGKLNGQTYINEFSIMNKSVDDGLFIPTREVKLSKVDLISLRDAIDEILEDLK